MGQWLCSASQRAFALIRRAESPLILRYRDAAERREKGRLCFIEGKGTPFISNNRNFKQEKVDISRNYITTPKTSGLSCENALVLYSSSHLFRERRPPNLPPLSALSSRTRTCARTDTHLHIAHSTSLFFQPSPFTFTPNSLSHCGLRVKKTINLTLHG